MEETIEQIYYKIKNESELSAAMLMYITFNNNTYNGGNSICVDFKNDKESIGILKKIQSKKDFYAFWNSKKGKKFYKDNEKPIKEIYTNMILQNAGYGYKLCKN